jgi:nitrogenase molybdenum-iron protein alpha/beta subunit
VVVVSTPDFAGCLESGYALAVKALIETLVPAERGRAGRRHPQVTVLAGSMLTPGDVEHIKELVDAFGLRPVVLPDLADSLDGHLTEQDFSPVTVAARGWPRSGAWASPSPPWSSVAPWTRRPTSWPSAPACRTGASTP